MTSPFLTGSEFLLRDWVYIDNCTDLKAVVTAVTWRGAEFVNYEVCWFSGGKAEVAIIEGWRLKKVLE